MSATPRHAKATPPPGKAANASINKSLQTTVSNDRLQVPFSWFDSVRENVPSDTCTLAEWVKIVRSDKYRATVARIRAIMDTLPSGFNEADLAAVKKKTDPIKKTLPAVAFSAAMESRHKDVAPEDRDYKHSGVLQIDVDHKDNPGTSMDEIRAKLMAHPSIIMVACSPSGGIKAACAIPACVDTHKASFKAAQVALEAVGIKIDGGTHDVPRLCFLTHDPGAWLREGHVEVITPLADPALRIAKETPAGQPADSPSRSKGVTASERKTTLEELPAILAAIPRQGYLDWLRIISGCWDEFGPDATPILAAAWEEDEPGETAKKYQHRLRDVKFGTVVLRAKEHGWQPRRQSTSTSTDASDIPGDVIPVPGGVITITKSADIIFRAASEGRRMFLRGGVVHEVGHIGDDVLLPIKPERFCSMVEKLGKRVASREEQRDKSGNAKVVWRSRTFPRTSAPQILAADEREHLPHIRQLANCPILTPSGDILGQGYHDFNGGTFISGGLLPPVVSLDAAVKALREILTDFDFPSPGDESRAVASLISPALKMGGHYKKEFPLDLAEADQSQSGKTYRQKIVCAIYREQPSTITKANGGVGSLDESISVALGRGRPFINIGNFRGSLASEILEEAICGNGKLQLRLPGGATPFVDTTAFLWQLSTNGAELTRDLANRSIITRIRKQADGYQYRKYLEGDLHAHILSRQPAFLGAVFAVVRAWIAAGSPSTDEHRHDFRGWVRIMDWIIQHIFHMPPLLDGHREEQMRTANPKLQWLRDIVVAILADGYDGHELTASDIGDIAEDHDIPPPGRRDHTEAASMRVGRTLGHIFREIGGDEVVVDGRRFTRSSVTERNPVNGNYKERKIYHIETT